MSVEPTRPTGITPAKVAKVAVGAVAVAGVAVAAIAAGKGDTFSKVKNAVENAESGKKLGTIFNRENIGKGFKSLGKDFAKLGNSIRTGATSAFETVKGVFTKGKNKLQK